MCPGQTNLNARVYWGMHIEQKACMACMRGCVCIGECGNGGKAGVLGNAGCWETGEMRIGQAKVKEAFFSTSPHPTKEVILCALPVRRALHRQYT